MAVLDPRRRRRSTLILLILTSITVMTLDYQGFGPLKSVQGGARGVVDPVVGALETITSPVANAWRGLTEYDDLKDENERLRAELAAQQGDSIRSRAAEDSLRELLDQVDVPFIGGAESLIAQVVDRPGNFESYSVEVDRGSDDGVRVGMPVVTTAGLVGRVTDVQPNFSQVRLLHQPDYAVGVRFVGSGEVALARGEGLGADLRVEEGLQDETNIALGDPVVTSGIDGSSYPPDLAVGVISEVNFDATTLERDVLIRPVANLGNLRFVTVILWTVDGASEQ